MKALTAVPTEIPKRARCEHIERLHEYLGNYRLEILTQEPDEHGAIHNPEPVIILCHKCGGSENVPFGAIGNTLAGR